MEDKMVQKNGDRFFYFKQNKLFNFLVNGNWGDWQNYGACNVTCGGGIKTRNRICDSPSTAFGGDDCQGAGSESQTCNNSPCPG